MTELIYKQHSTYQPKLCKPIKKVEISQDNIFITDANNRIYQFWLDWDGLPKMQIIEP